MSLLRFIRSQLIEIIQWNESSRYTLVWCFPDEDHEIKNGAKLVCQEGQAAILVNEGQLADVFGPGTHTLNTQNLPILSRLKGWKYGFESPFKVKVYFVNLRQYIDQKWGTSNPVIIRDPEFAVGNRPGRVRIRAFGSYNFQIQDPRVFFEQVVGTAAEISSDEVERFAKTRLVSAFSRAASSANVPVAEIHSHVESLSNKVKEFIAADFAQIGLALTSFIIENVSLPAEVEKALDAAAAQSARGVDNTMAWESVQAMRDAARQSGQGGGNNPMQAGMGMGMGMGMGQMMNQMFGSGMQAPGHQPAGPMNPGGYPHPGAGAMPPQQAQPAPTLESKLRKLKAAFEAELITEEEYAAKKAELLADF